MIFETNCDAVMIGRASMGNPWLLQRVVHFLDNAELLPEVGVSERLSMALRHLNELCETKGEFMGVRQMRKFGAWYVKGLPEATKIREKLIRATSKTQICELLLEYLDVSSL
jgi:tRNA-dihydrouridine synthase